MADFSLELNEDQLQIQKWVHDFAENVIRPAAHEWDEREETPWPIIEEAATIGLYSFDFIAQAFGDPTGFSCPWPPRSWPGETPASRWPSWAPRSAWRALPATGRPSRSGSGYRSASVPPTRSSWPRSPCPSPTPAPTCRRCAPGPSTTRPRTSGCSTAPRRGSPTAASPTSTWWWPPSSPSWSRGAGQFIVPPGTPGLSQGQKFKKMGIRASHTAEVVLDDCPGARQLSARRQGQARRAAGPGPRGQAASSQAAMKTFEATRPPVGAQALGIARAAYEYSLEYAKERKAFGEPSSRTRPSPSSWPT